jgi:hypothetical protein
MFGSVILLLATLIQPVRGGDKISVDPRLSRDGISVGTTIEGALLITVAGGWHINTASPSDENLVATAASFSPPGGLTVDGVRFPRAAARKFAFSETPVEVYEGTFVVRFSLTAAPGTPPGSFLLGVDVAYQA